MFEECRKLFLKKIDFKTDVRRWNNFDSNSNVLNEQINQKCKRILFDAFANKIVFSGMFFNFNFLRFD